MSAYQYAFLHALQQAQMISLTSCTVLLVADPFRLPHETFSSLETTDSSYFFPAKHQRVGLDLRLRVGTLRSSDCRAN